MNYQLKKIFRSISKVVLLLTGIGLLGYFGYLTYLSVVFKPMKVRVTNVTDSSFTVSWVTDRPMKGIVYYKDTNSFLPGPLGWLGSMKAYDDRDYAYAQGRCVENFNSTVVLDEDFVVSGDNFDCENIKVDEHGEYYTHHVTLKNLDSDKRYFFRVGDGYFSWDVEGVSSSKTFEYLDTVKEPIPIFGRVVDSDGLYTMDSLVYIKFNNFREGKESIYYSSATNEEGGWYMDGSYIRTEVGELVGMESGQDIFEAEGQYMNYGSSDKYEWVFGYFDGSYPDIVVEKKEAKVRSFLLKIYAQAPSSRGFTVPEKLQNDSKGQTQIITPSVKVDNASRDRLQQEGTKNVVDDIAKRYDGDYVKALQEVGLCQNSVQCAANLSAVTGNGIKEKDFVSNSGKAMKEEGGNWVENKVTAGDDEGKGYQSPSPEFGEAHVITLDYNSGKYDTISFGSSKINLSDFADNETIKKIKNACTSGFNNYTSNNDCNVCIGDKKDSCALNIKPEEISSAKYFNNLRGKIASSLGSGQDDEARLIAEELGKYSKFLGDSLDYRLDKVDWNKEEAVGVNIAGSGSNQQLRLRNESGTLRLEILGQDGSWTEGINIGAFNEDKVFFTNQSDLISLLGIDVNGKGIELNALVDAINNYNNLYKETKDLGDLAGKYLKEIAPIQPTITLSVVDYANQYNDQGKCETPPSGQQGCDCPTKNPVLPGFSCYDSYNSQSLKKDQICLGNDCMCEIDGNKYILSGNGKCEAKSPKQEIINNELLLKVDKLGGECPKSESNGCSCDGEKIEAGGKCEKYYNKNFEARKDGYKVNFLGRNISAPRVASEILRCPFEKGCSCVGSKTVGIPAGGVCTNSVDQRDGVVYEEIVFVEGIKFCNKVEGCIGNIPYGSRMDSNINLNIEDYQNNLLFKMIDLFESIISNPLVVKGAYASIEQDSEYTGDGYIFYLPEYGFFDLEVGGLKETDKYEGGGLKIFYIEANGIPGLQFPEDMDNPQVGEDFVLRSNALKISYEKSANSYPLDIKEGINIISFDYLPKIDTERHTKASDLLIWLNNRGITAEYISYFDGGRWKGVSYFDGNNTGQDFSIVPGRGYLIFSRDTSTINVPGYKVTDSVPIPLSNGWNLVGIHGYNKAYTARSFIDSISKVSGLTADNVSWWPTSKGRYEGLQVTDGKSYGFDFPISPKNGYFVRISKYVPEKVECKSIIWHEGGDLHGTCGNSKSIF